MNSDRSNGDVFHSLGALNAFAVVEYQSDALINDKLQRFFDSFFVRLDYMF